MSGPQAVSHASPQIEGVDPAAPAHSPPTAPPSAEQIVQEALQQAGVSDLSALTKQQAEDLLDALKAAQTAQLSGQTDGQTKGLNELIISLETTIGQWPTGGQTAIEQELDRAKGAQSALEALQRAVGNGSVGLAGQVDLALSRVNSQVSALTAATEAIVEQLPTSGPEEPQARQQLDKLSVTLGRLKQVGYSEEQLSKMGITELQTELDHALSDPEASGVSLRRAGLSALGNYLQGRVEAGELDEKSAAILRNSAMSQGLDATGNLKSMNKAWETEARNVTNLESYTKKNLQGAANELNGLMQDAINRGDFLAAGSIKAKIDAINKKIDSMGNSEHLGMGAMLLFMQLNTIDLATKNLIRNDLLSAKEKASRAGDDKLVGELQTQIDTLDTQIKTLTEHMNVFKEQIEKVMEDISRHTQEIEKQSF